MEFSETGTGRDLNELLPAASEFDVAKKSPEQLSYVSLADGSQRNEDESDEDESRHRPRKRRRYQDNEDLESTYFNRLRTEEGRASDQESTADEAIEPAQEDGITDLQVSAGIVDSEAPPLHESLAKSSQENDPTVSQRTVFLGNVSTEAIRSKNARKELLKHLSSVVENLPPNDPPHKLVSLRFRSTAFVASAGPKKAAYAKKELMDATTKSTNAYVVYSAEATAQKSAAQLNGTVVNGRHLRADYLGSPSLTDHKRCIFVGNLPLVDDETALPDNADQGENLKPQRPKAKQPADVEEGLWQTFEKCGKIESVRVVRDRETRVGKGFAYVQFKDENAVESALLMDGKKIPPMLPRVLRVVRAKSMKSQSVSRGPRSERVEGRSIIKGSKSRDMTGSKKAPGSLPSQKFVFEGHRASSGRAKSKDKEKKSKIKRGTKPGTRSARRAATFRAAGSKTKTGSK